ncbi:MAG: zinc ribbon domain-containing protein [Thermoplasmata archaeon]
MVLLDNQTIALLVILLVFIFVILIEVRFLRKRRMTRSRKAPLEDQAFNALLNARAISNTLARDGTDLRGVNDVLSQANQSLEKGDFRGSLELTDYAKEMMKTVKAKSEAAFEPEGTREFVETEPTTKEVLKKKFPENYLEARFSRSLAVELLQKAKDAGLDLSDAERLLRLCDDCVNEEDYTHALSYAIQSKKVAEDALSTVSPEVAKVEQSQTCRSCGVEILSGDMFCRKCGTKVNAVCDGCGKKLEEGDAFCRACGARLES